MPLVEWPDLWPVTSANCWQVLFLMATCIIPALYTLWWYRHDILKPLLAIVDAVGLLGIRLYSYVRKVTR